MPKPPNLILSSCGCCSNGCTCYNHSQIGSIIVRCPIHAFWSLDEIRAAWVAQVEEDPARPDAHLPCTPHSLVREIITRMGDA